MTKREPPTKLELEVLRPATRPALLEHERPPTAERVPAPLLERVLLLVRVGVVAPVEPRPQLRVGEHLVRLVDGLHLPLGLLLGQPLLGGLVRVVHLRQLPVGGLDLALISVARHAQDLVVVLCLGALERHLGFPKEGVDRLVELLVLARFFSLVEGVDGGFEVLGFGLDAGAVEEAVDRVLV